MPWYQGPTLLSALDTFQEPKRQTDKPLRFSIFKRFKVSGYGTVWIGKVQTGTIKLYDTISIGPKGSLNKTISIEYLCLLKGYSVELKRIQRFEQELKEAVAGQVVSMHAKALSVRDLERGNVIVNSRQDTVKPPKSFVAHIVVLFHPTQIKEVL